MRTLLLLALRNVPGALALVLAGVVLGLTLGR